MVETGSKPSERIVALEAEVTRQNKIIEALMDRAERSASAQASEFGLFQTSVMLEEQVRTRTAQLDAALRENERITRNLRESEARFSGLIHQSLVGICIIEEGRFTFTNPRFSDIFGYNAEELGHMGPADLACERDCALVASQCQRCLTGETTSVAYAFRARRKDGRIIDVEVHGGTMTVGAKLALISMLVDISERAHAERAIRALRDELLEQATHDALTGLYNRRYLEQGLGHELAKARRDGAPVSVIMGDIDHFKRVNDEFGHLAGDAVLRKFGALMRAHLRGGDTCCRYGGEEFVVVLPGVTPDCAAARAEQLRQRVARAVTPYGLHSIRVTGSFGVAAMPGDGSTMDNLIAAADRALYAAKAAGRNRVSVGAGSSPSRAGTRNAQAKSERADEVRRG